MNNNLRILRRWSHLHEKVTSECRHEPPFRHYDRRKGYTNITVRRQTDNYFPALCVAEWNHEPSGVCPECVCTGIRICVSHALSEVPENALQATILSLQVPVPKRQTSQTLLSRNGSIKFRIKVARSN